MAAARRQGQQLFAPDGLTYLVAQSDSNLVLYRLYEPNGQTYGNIWQSASNGGSPAPFPFVMQQARAQRAAAPPCVWV